LENLVASVRFVGRGGAVLVPRNTAYELCFLAMTSPWTKNLLALLEVKVSIEERVVGNSPERSRAIRRIVPHLVRTFLDDLMEGL
jgi:hypothetical protein